MKNKILLSLLALCLIAVIILGVKIASNNMSKGSEGEEDAQYSEPAEVATPAVADKAFRSEATMGKMKSSNVVPSAVPKTERKIIYTANLQIEVNDFTKAMDQVRQITKSNKGYVGSSSVQKDSQKIRYANFVLRVAPQKLDATILSIKSLGELIAESEQGQDITKEFYDLQARVDNAKKFEARILKLLGTKTTKIKDVLEVEQELDRVRENIETMQGELRYYNNVVGLATVNLAMHEKGVSIPSRINWLQPIIDTFSEALGAFSVSLGAIIVMVFGVAPWGILAIAVVYVGALLWKRLKH